ncbi:AraC family transcriptional regulator [Acidomonas methanolica]|uniref:AraC family transcriptional regulator n=1 Tax=Acidomonas methanolica TaxID=437 RepID=UPI002119D4BC|nr:AraC family transcriptional regulator [Acidomonas methanolica]MCQ9154314.1 AraC family transcriptional regulator [Acidomonas methanolica]
MQEMIIRLRDMVERHCAGSAVRTVVPGLMFFREEAPTMPAEVLYDPRFCIIVQGAKQVVLCDRVFNYDARNYMVTAVDLPVTGQVTLATSDEPYLALCLTLDPGQIAELLLDVQDDELKHGPLCPSCMSVSPLTAEILDPVTRLVTLVERPQDIPVLLPLFQRELLFRLLQGPQGYVLRQIATSGSNLSQINRAMHWIRDHYREPFDIGSVARIAGMSPSSFHRHFRSATMMSPLQYRTRLRLQDARRRLMQGRADAAEVAFAVGYESPSQFSRDYRRMFGHPPVRDVSRIRALSA